MVLYSKLVTILKVFLNYNRCTINAECTQWLYIQSSVSESMSPGDPIPGCEASFFKARWAQHVTHNLNISHTVYTHNLISLLVLQILMKSKPV